MTTLKYFLDRCCNDIILRLSEKEFNTHDVISEIIQRKEWQEEYIKLSNEYGSYNKLNAQIGRYLGNKRNQERLDIEKNGGKQKSTAITGRKSPNQKWRKKLFIVLLLLLCVSSYSQTPIPPKGKLKTIEYLYGTNQYTSRGYSATGYIYKGEFEENQPVTFSVTYTGIKISGIYCIGEDGTAYINGIYSNSMQTISISREIFSVKGLFRITNKKNGIGITANKKEGSELKFWVEDLPYYQVENAQSVYSRNVDSVILQKLPDNTYSLTVKYNDDRNYVLEIPVSRATLQKLVSSLNGYGSYKFEQEIKEVNDAKGAKIIFNSGRVFIGTVKKKKDKDMDYEPHIGTCKYVNGDIFTGEYQEVCIPRRLDWDGNLTPSGRIEIPTKGKTVFADGKTAEGDWLKQYNFTDDEWKKILKDSKSLTDIRDMAFNLNEEKKQKILDEKLAKERAKQEKMLKEKEKKEAFISKYGEHFGTIVSQGEIVAGMSQEMVNEIWNKEFFIISTSIRSGQSYEIWEFSKDKMETEIMLKGSEQGEEGAKAALAIIQMMSLAEQMGGTTIPKMLIFTNGKLTDIYR